MGYSDSVNRRSFLAKVTGGIAIGALGAIAGPARAFQGYTGITDRDSGSNADAGGYGRGGQGSATARPYTGYTDRDPNDPVNTGRNPGAATGVTDQDSGSSADNAGYGRGGPGSRQGGSSQFGATDNDPTDAAGEGRGRYSGFSDQDTGSYSDNAGYGRGGSGSRPDPQVPSGQGYTGITDQDTGSRSDNAGYGRGGLGSGPTDTAPGGNVATGITDADTGSYSDNAGYGRGTTHTCSDNDPYPNADPGGAGRRC